MTNRGHFHGFRQEGHEPYEGRLSGPHVESKDDQWFDGFSRRLNDHKMKVHGDEMRPLRITKITSGNISTTNTGVTDVKTRDLRKEENAYWNTEICRAREWLENKNFEIEKQWKRIEGDDQHIPEGFPPVQPGIEQKQSVGIHMVTSTDDVHKREHLSVNTKDDIQAEEVREPPKKRYRSFVGD